MLQPIRIPDMPPDLGTLLTLDEDQNGRARTLLTDLSSALDGLPVMLSQAGVVVASVGVPSETFGEKMARAVARVWREDSNRPAREVIRFTEEVFDEDASRASLMLYSVHIEGALTLSVGWQLTLSLTQVRAEVNDVRTELWRSLGVEGY